MAKSRAALTARIEELQRDLEAARATIDSEVDVRVAIAAQAMLIAQIDYSGMTPPEVRAAAVAACIGAERISDKSDAYIATRFALLLEDYREQIVEAAQTQREKAFDEAAASAERAGKMAAVSCAAH